MLRVRLTYAKRGRACFIPHIAIPSVFSRSGARAAISFQLSEGFSPRPRISLGPELPVGVPALSEPLEVRLNKISSEELSRWNSLLPQGFFFTGARIINGEPGSDEAKSLNKCCKASSCIIALRRSNEESVLLLDSLLNELKDSGEITFFERDSTLNAHIDNPPYSGFIRCIMENPSQRSPGFLVKILQKRGIIKGWPDVFILREVVGGLSIDAQTAAPSVLPLASSLLLES